VVVFDIMSKDRQTRPSAVPLQARFATEDGFDSVSAALAGRRYLGIELKEKYCRLAERRLAGVERFVSGTAKRLHSSPPAGELNLK
jgi:hypothetical protein